MVSPTGGYRVVDGDMEPGEGDVPYIGLERMAAAEAAEAKSLTVSALIRESHATAVEKGWWQTERPFSEGIALMHSELSEALEEWRQYGMEEKMLLYVPPDGLPIGKPEGIAAEFADVLIRIADWCGKHNIPLEEAFRAKMAYNKTRSHRHGGKLA